MSDAADIPPAPTPQSQRELLARLLHEKARREIRTSPLSYGQRALWFLYQLDRSSPAYNIMYAAEVHAKVEIHRLQCVFQALVHRHAALRTTYSMRAGTPVQEVHPYVELPWEVVDAEGWDAQQLEEQLRVASDAPFDLERGPVLRLKLYRRVTGRHVLLFVAHHVAIDFWSLDLLFDEVETLYATGADGQPDPLPALDVEYADFVRWQTEMLDSPAGERSWNFWRDQLSGELPELDLPVDRVRPPLQTFRGQSHRHDFPVGLLASLEALSRSHDVTLFTTLLAAFQVFLMRCSGQDDIVVGTPTAGRSRREMQPVVGYFANPIAIRVRAMSDRPFAEFLATVRTTLIAGIEHQDYPFPLLVERLRPPRDTSRSPVFQVAFVWDKPRKLVVAHPTVEPANTKADQAILGLQPFALGQQGAAFDLTLMMLNAGDSLASVWQYNSDLFEPATIARLAGHFEVLLAGLVADPACPLGDLPLLGAADQFELLHACNDTTAEYPKHAALHELVEQQVDRTPAAIAVTGPGGTLTYQQLDERANQLARYLRRRGVRTGELVGICVDRSVDMVVGLVAILKVGGTYVPLAPGTPAARIAAMLDECQAQRVVTDGSHLELPGWTGEFVRIDTDGPAIAREANRRLARTAGPEQLAYVIFTSGSTGKPKGVEVQHRAVVNFLTSMQREPGIEPHDVLLAVTTPTFDISVLELFLPLTVGATVVIAAGNVVNDPLGLISLLTESRATVMQATPATWRLLIEAGWRGGPGLKVLCGGEALARVLADQLLVRSGSLWNMYGPTETTVWSAVDRVRPRLSHSRSGDESGPAPIGRPIANTQLYVLDAQLHPMPIGVRGDLYIGGDGLARGYLNQPHLTAEKFVAPGRPDILPARIYKTGDLARRRPDGRIDFLGRADFQVKVRGFRIELAEIETHLLEHPAVSQAVVVARESAHHADTQLVAYLIGHGTDRPSTSELRDFLRRQLPDYMLPATLLWLEQLPLSAAGKVDRRALPAPDSTRPELRAAYVAPRDATEAALAGVWARVLRIDRIGVHDNFFDLGGASIQSLEIASRAREAGCHVTPSLIFQHPTIAALAAAAPMTEPGLHRSPMSDPGSDRPLRERGPADESPASRPAPDKISPRSAPASPGPPVRRCHSLIESLGVYLPPTELTSAEVLAGCARPIWFPLQEMTGIRSRRVAGESEFSIDLARAAVAECLRHSRYAPEDIDLVVCCNITRIDQPGAVTVEPTTALQLTRHFGFKNAIVLDINNACAGMFTGMSLVDAFIATGEIRRGMVVSGEYVSEIMRTAQREIDALMDSRLACLTVGDAGAAVILEAAPSPAVGFHELEMYTLSKYCRMCIGRLTEHVPGGPIMHLPDPMEQTAVTVTHSVQHALQTFERSPWPAEEVQHVILHQTSERSLLDARRAINEAFGKPVCRDDNTINNLAARGNTATTTHVVAMWDQILSGRIQSGDRVVFGITGSGQTIGTGLYTFDDLPNRLRTSQTTGSRVPARAATDSQDRPKARPHARRTPAVRIRIQCVGTLPRGVPVVRDTPRMTAQAAEVCLARSSYTRREIELLLFAGTLRTEFISEPAIATLVAEQLQLNTLVDSTADYKTFAFDVYNGPLGLLSACHVSAQLIRSGKYRNSLVVASEIDVNKDFFPQHPLGIEEAASALILDASPEPSAGFGQFVFRCFPQHFELRTMVARYTGPRPFCDLVQRPHLEDHYLDCIQPAVEELLDREGLGISDIDVLLPPQFSSEFNHRLVERLGLPRDRLIDLDQRGYDLCGSALAYGLERVSEQRRAKAGDVGLIISVGSGIQVACATYYF